MDIKRTTVELTSEDIAGGERFNPKGCPFHKALKRATGLEWSVVTNWATHTKPRDCFSERVVNALLPLEVCEAIKKFDAFGPEAIKPMSFEFNYALI